MGVDQERRERVNMTDTDKRRRSPRRRSLTAPLLSLSHSNDGEQEERHPAVYSESQRRRSLKSLPIVDNAGELFRHPDIPSLDIDKIFSDILLTNSNDCVARCRRLSNEMSRMSLL